MEVRQLAWKFVAGEDLDAGVAAVRAPQRRSGPRQLDLRRYARPHSLERCITWDLLAVKDPVVYGAAREWAIINVVEAAAMYHFLRRLPEKALREQGAAQTQVPMRGLKENWVLKEAGK